LTNKTSVTQETSDFYHQSFLLLRQFCTIIPAKTYFKRRQYCGMHPNDIKVSDKDTNGQLAIVEYLELGYYDYQHLVRDFKEFTNLTPNGFLITEGKAPKRTFGKAEI